VAAYTWNARNLLTGRGTTSFQYDSYGRRSLNPAGNNLFYDGSDVAQELSGSTPVANRIVGGTDEFFNRSDSTGSYSPITDALGSVLALANSSGTIVTQYGYDPFGSTTAAGAGNTNSSQYTGRENDGNGLYYYRARYYNPTIGRFISQDPAGFNGGGSNLYSYTLNSPTNLRDPGGQNPACLLGGLLGTMAYNSYVIYQSMAGRKSTFYAGWSGLGHIAAGNAVAFGAGCGVGSLLGPLGFAVPEGTGAVYGGGNGAAQAAAEASGLNLIQDTIGGQIAENLTAGAPSWLSNWVWDYASAQYASGLQGTVTVFEGSFGEFGQFAAQSDLVTVEMPILQNAVENGVVTLVSGAVP
jgi:RHS repeat-associated protein